MGGRELEIVLVRQGTKFPKQYVGLFDDPLTLTDQWDTPGRTRPLRRLLPGWWSKMELFAPENESIRPCLFFDLDTYVLGDISDLLQPFEGLGMLRDFNFPERPASGVMFVPRDTDRIWREWERCPQLHMDRAGRKGDQAFIGKFCDWFIQDRFEGIVSYKKHARENPTGRIVCFHGFPKPHECDGWAGEFWNKPA